MPGFVRASLSRRSALSLALAGVSAVAGCGTSHAGEMRTGEPGDSSTEDAGSDASAPAAGFVRCGEQLCDVASGNQCYACSKTDFHCHTRDLPTECEPIAWFDCDGREDCAGAACEELCRTPEGCSMPSTACTLL